MNNDQFRRLVSATSSKSGDSKNGGSPNTASPAPTGAAALGSRQRTSIPMTPRSVGGGRSEFARQLAARDQANRQKQTFKTSAPKGSRLGQGYTDRAKIRHDDETDERAIRIKALEELLKNEEIDQDTFDKQRAQIAGGDLSSTHLVKGLDFKLLERVRRGEDVYGSTGGNENTGEAGAAEASPDVDDAFDELESQEVQAAAKQQAQEKKKGQLSNVALVPGKKRTRDQIIAEMKAARAAAKAQQDSLGDRFKKIGAKQKAGTRIERDSKGREVMIIVDEDGHEKRKVRKLQPGQEEARKQEDLVPDTSAAPLGMEVPEFYRKRMEEEAAAAAEEDDNDDIFADAGDDYDPLGGSGSGSDSDEDSDVEGSQKKGEPADPEEGPGLGVSKAEADAREAMPPPPPAGAAARSKPAPSRNYFEGSKSELLSAKVHKTPSMSDPSLQAAFKKAAQMGAAVQKKAGDGDGDDDDLDEEEARKRAARRKQMLESSARDDMDMDMGFGTSRFEDEEDGEDGGSKVKLSKWGDDDDGDGPSRGGGGGKRKRGPKKRKGDVNSAEDVLRVMEQRKKG